MMRTAQLCSSAITFSVSSAIALAGGVAQTPGSAVVEEVWVEPADLEQRDLFRGPAGPMPAEKATFIFVREDRTGRSPGYDVKDENGVVWSVKLGPESQSEVVSSRILWAIGFHQPPTFHLTSWTLTDAPTLTREAEADDLGGRFRPEMPGYRVVGDWKWDENPHASSRAMRGLLVAQMMINNWDLKSSNNKLYEVTDSGGPARRYVVRDLGASLGSNEQAKWVRWLGIRAAQGSKNDLAGFLASGFIDNVRNGRVTFEYSGPNKPLLDGITTEDVKWTAQLMSRLTDQQWDDAFRAGGYSPDDRAKFIAKFKEKIAAGLALP
jgi:hypothetical protein